ncbi:TPA: hypothetical protein DEP86_01755, partial [Candidatus Uhrbacteria bacterium]|nr:hypothetical protein [Candidatus Uhrbacteria bacterium]
NLPNKEGIVERGRDFFLPVDLFRHLAKTGEVRLVEWSNGTDAWLTFGEFSLDGAEVNGLLERHGFFWQDHPDVGYGIKTLVDGNWQERNVGCSPSREWIFPLLPTDNIFDLEVHYDLTVELRAKLVICQQGIVLFPVVVGSHISASDTLPNARLFRVLVKANDGLAPLARKMAEVDKLLGISWAGLGLEGIRRVQDLFSDFSTVRGYLPESLAEMKIFCPNPKSERRSEDMYVVASAQAEVIKDWRDQLRTFLELN